jgi:hypothetical protein
MNLSFNKRFKEKILAGTKIHTIREDKHNRWDAGKTIHFVTGLRTSRQDCFALWQCTSVQKIEIKYNPDKDKKHYFPIIHIDGLEITSLELFNLAKNDGFKNERDFLTWFDKDFTGKLIHWTKFKY